MSTENDLGGAVIGWVLIPAGVIAITVLAILIKRGYAWKEVPGSRNRFTGFAVNWFTLVVLLYLLIVSLVCGVLFFREV